MRVMSLFAGYGGLDLALGMVFPEARTVYVSDIEEGPYRGVEFARIMCTTSGAVSKEDMKEVNTADWFAMAGPHVREGVREVIAEAYWTKVGIVGGAVSLHLMFKELQEGHVK